LLHLIERDKEDCVHLMLDIAETRISPESLFHVLSRAISNRHVTHRLMDRLINLYSTRRIPNDKHGCWGKCGGKECGHVWNLDLNVDVAACEGKAFLFAARNGAHERVLKIFTKLGFGVTEKTSVWPVQQRFLWVIITLVAIFTKYSAFLAYLSLQCDLGSKHTS
ncbi:hypothetical protein BC829DRAFT_394068, partial [Chytridium lagenaria]